MMSIIPTYNPEVIVVDQKVNHGILIGISNTQATVISYLHNDMGNLKQILESVSKSTLGRSKRKFLITEGIFEETGKIADLPSLISLKKKYGYHLIIDERCKDVTIEHF